MKNRILFFVSVRQVLLYGTGIYVASLLLIFRKKTTLERPLDGLQNLITSDLDVNPYGNISKGDVSWLQKSIDLFRRLETEPGQTQCRKLVEVGGNGCNGEPWGMKLLCLDPDVAPDRSSCVVYSFGVERDISFDKGVAQYGCQVYMMDPTLQAGAYDWVTGRLAFLPVGLGGRNVFEVDEVGDMNGKVILTLDKVSLFTKYDGPVHYLKIDIEMSEWKSLEYILDHNLLVGVMQIMIEFHFFVPPESMKNAVEFYRQQWLLLERFEDYGFLRVRYDVTRSPVAYVQMPDSDDTAFVCGELFFIRRGRAVKL